VAEWAKQPARWGAARKTGYFYCNQAPRTENINTVNASYPSTTGEIIIIIIIIILDYIRSTAIPSLSWEPKK
jgi:hypothetical protein